MKTKRIGLALSGGGVRGIAHIGVLKVFEEEGIPIHCISGTSMGGVVAALYARNKSAADVEKAARRLSRPRELLKLLTPSPPQRGILDGARVQAYLSHLFEDTLNFSDLIMPLGLLAVDLVHPQEIYLSEGPLLPAVVACCAVPGLFQPVEIGVYRLVDGGILNNLPVCMLAEMGAEITIAVDVQLDPFVTLPWQELSLRPHIPFPMPDSFLDFYRSELIMVNKLMHLRLAETPPNILIHPEVTPDVTMLTGFRKVPEIISAGEIAARKAMAAIKEYL